jgi:hypothetical protein
MIVEFDDFRKVTIQVTIGKRLVDLQPGNIISWTMDSVGHSTPRSVARGDDERRFVGRIWCAKVTGDDRLDVSSRQFLMEKKIVLLRLLIFLFFLSFSSLET